MKHFHWWFLREARDSICHLRNYRLFVEHSKANKEARTNKNKQARKEKSDSLRFRRVLSSRFYRALISFHRPPKKCMGLSPPVNSYALLLMGWTVWGCVGVGGWWVGGGGGWLRRKPPRPSPPALIRTNGLISKPIFVWAMYATSGYAYSII